MFQTHQKEVKLVKIFPTGERGIGIVGVWSNWSKYWENSFSSGEEDAVGAGWGIGAG